VQRGNTTKEMPAKDGAKGSHIERVVALAIKPEPVTIVAQLQDY